MKGSEIRVGSVYAVGPRSRLRGNEARRAEVLSKEGDWIVVRLDPPRWHPENKPETRSLRSRDFLHSWEAQVAWQTRVDADAVARGNSSARTDALAEALSAWLSEKWGIEDGAQRDAFRYARVSTEALVVICRELGVIVPLSPEVS